jgi:hypothetical protein
MQKKPMNNVCNQIPQLSSCRKKLPFCSLPCHTVTHFMFCYTLLHSVRSCPDYTICCLGLHYFYYTADKWYMQVNQKGFWVVLEQDLSFPVVEERRWLQDVGLRFHPLISNSVARTISSIILAISFFKPTSSEFRHLH